MTADNTGAASARDIGDDYAQTKFMVKQLMSRMATAIPVTVLSVTNAGGVVPVGMLDCQPMVQQMDGAGKAVDHAILHNVPYFRLQGGANAVIIDPSVGDMGLVVFASSDISRVKNTKTTGLPGSKRKFDWGDGLYIGGFFNGTPSQYILFTDAGIEIASPLVSVPGNFEVGTGASGSFATGDGRTVTVRAGIITDISGL